MKTEIIMPGVDFVGIVAGPEGPPLAIFDVPKPDDGRLTTVRIPLYDNESIKTLGPRINAIGNVTLTLHIEIEETEDHAD